MRLIIALLFVVYTQSVALTTYYVSSAGNDANNGTSTATPWKTPMRISLTSYNAGDSILFKRGDTFEGQFLATLHGTSTHPIVIATYGTGNRPIFYGDMRERTWVPVTGKTGVYKMYVGANTMMSLGSYQFYNGAWTKFRGDFYNLTPATIDSVTEGRMAMTPNYDTLYLHTFGSVAMPTSRDSIRVYRRANRLNPPSHYAIVRDLDVRNFCMAIEIGGNVYADTGSNNITVRNISAYNCLDGMYLERTTDSVIDSCQSELIGNTQIYLRATTRCRVRYNSVKTTSSIVDGIPCTGDMCGIGVQGSYTSSMNTSGYGYNTVEYNSLDNTGTIDFWYNIGDTIRYNTGINMNGGIYPHGTNLVIQGNSMTLKDGAPAGGMSTANIGSGPITITGNSFLNAGGYAVWLMNDSASIGGTVTFSNNTVSGRLSHTDLMWIGSNGYGITSTNNRYYGLGVWGASPSQSLWYSTLPEFQAATGFESGSTWSETYVPPEPEPVAVRKVLIKRRY